MKRYTIRWEDENSGGSCVYTAETARQVLNWFRASYPGAEITYFCVENE